MRISKTLLVICALAMLLGTSGCKSEEQIAQGVQSSAAIRDVVYNEAPEVQKCTIVVNGSGEVKTVPDSATISFNITTKEKEATAAQAKNEEIVKLVIETMLSDGISEKDMKTAGLSLYEQYDYGKSEPVLTGYEASSRIELTIRDVENIGSIIADALAAGVTNYDGLSFSATDTDRAYEKALAAAVEDAQGKASAIAAAAERELVGILTIEEQSQGQPVLYEIPATDSAKGMNVGDANGISTGEVTTSAQIAVTYEIK